MMKGYFLLFVILLSTFIPVACTSADKNSPQPIGTLESVLLEYAGLTNPLPTDGTTEGARIFQANCETCHGPEGQGDGPAAGALDPQPKNLAALQAVANDDYLFWRISDGKPGTAMVPWKGVLSEEQIWQVIMFIRGMK